MVDPPLRRSILPALLAGVVLIITIVALTTGTAAVASDAQPELPGNGTADDPYVITTAEELATVEDDLDAHYVLEDDITVTESINIIGEIPWRETNVNRSFTGVFDGHGHTITYDTPDRIHYRIHSTLFGVNDGTIQNLTVDSPTPTVNRERGIRGYAVGQIAMENTGTIRNVSINEPVLDATTGGAIVGENRGGTITNSTVRGIQFDNDGANSAAGGIVGKTQNGTITSVSVTGEIDGDATGGIAGIANGTSFDQIQSSATVNGEIAGGVIGEAAAVQIEDAAAFGSVDGDVSGGLVGDVTGRANTTIERTVVASSVSGTDQAGGIAGTVTPRTGTELLAASYWDTERAGQTDAVGNGSATAVGLSTTEMTGNDTVERLGLGEQWQAQSGYPLLTTQLEERVRLIDWSMSEQLFKEGETVGIDLTVQNLGTTPQRYNSTVGDREVRTEPIQPGEQQEISINWTARETGTQVITVDRITVGTLAVTDQPVPELVDLDAPQAIEPEQEYDIWVRAKNPTDIPIEETVVYESANRTIPARFSRSSNESVRVSGVSGEANTSITHRVSVGNQSLNATTDVVEETGFRIDEIDAPETVREFEEFPVTVTITNIGEYDRETDVTLKADGSYHARENVSLGAGEQTAVELTYTSTSDYVYDVTQEGGVQVVVEGGNWRYGVEHDRKKVDIAVGDRPENETENDARGSEDTDSTDDDGAGFTVARAVVALLVTGLVGRRYTRTTAKKER